MHNIEPKLHRQHSHTTYINIICFFMMMLFGIAGGTLEMYSYWQNFLWEFTNAFFITACSLTSVQLADRKWIIPAAGYIILSISFIEFFGLIPVNSIEKFQEAGKCGILFLPAMIMISYFKPFPVWLRVLGIVSAIPFMILFLLSEFSHDVMLHVVIYSGGYGLIEITAVSWGIYFLKILRSEQRNSKT